MPITLCTHSSSIHPCSSIHHPFLPSSLPSPLPSPLPSFPSLSFLLAVDCGSLPTPRNGSTHGNATTFPQKVQFKCDNGFDLLGSSVRECQANRTWSGMEVNCEGNAKYYLLLRLFFMVCCCCLKFDCGVRAIALLMH